MFTGLPFDTPCYQIVSLLLPLSHAMLFPVILDALTGRGLANPGKEMKPRCIPIFVSNSCLIVQESQARVPRHLLAQEL